MSRDILQTEPLLLAQLEAACNTDPQSAAALLHALLFPLPQDCTPAESAAYARCICRVLLHRRMKTRLLPLLQADTLLRDAVFGQLNTYKHSLVFLLKHIARADDTALLAKVMQLLEQNPYRAAQAPAYSAKWTLADLAHRVLQAPDEYLSVQSRAMLLRWIA